MKTKNISQRCCRLARIIIASVVVLFIMLIAALHILAFLFSRHDRVMRQFASQTFTDSAGHTIFYYELPQMNAEWNIVFIHGTPGSAAAFHQQFAHPFPRANLFALDRPGFGPSGPGLRKPSLDDQANAADALLKRLPARKTILVGHSYGGPVALETALKFPGDVSGVLLIGGSVDPAQEHIYLIQRIGNWPIVSWLLPRPLRQCNRELLTLRGDLIQLRSQLATLAVPVVMLHGTIDHQVPVANVEYLRSQLAADGKSNLFDAIVIPNYNHFIPWEHPDAVEQALEKLTNHIIGLENH